MKAPQSLPELELTSQVARENFLKVNSEGEIFPEITVEGCFDDENDFVKFKSSLADILWKEAWA